ncbi:transcriptional repressor general negative regulator of transcription subunit 4 [Sorochytrium milnesiophthora]
MDGDSEYELVCPLCCEDIDLEDKYFRPCPCGYQICRFCWNKIYEETNRLCPACRREYDKESVQFTPVPADELARLKKRKAQRLKKKEDKVDVVSSALPRPSRPAPPSKDVKVIQKNLVYVTGVPSSKANEDMLRSHDYFGQFGKIVKLVIHRKLPPSLQTHDPQVSVYITYANPQSAAQAIAFLDGAYVVGEARPLRASFGTTKYCASFLSGRSCTNRDCVYLHEYGEEVEDVSSVTGPRMPQGGPIRILGQGEQAKAANGAQVTAVAVAAVPSARDADAGPILPPTASWASRKPNMSAREAKTLRQASASPSGNMSDNDFPTMEEATAGTGAASESGSAAQQIAQTKPRKKKQKIKEQVPDPPLEEVPPNTGHDTRQDHHPTNAAPETPADELRQPAVRRTTPVADIASVVLEAFPPHVPIIRPITRPGSPASENGWPDTQPVSAYATRSPTPHSIREPMWPPRSSRWVLQALQAAPATPQKYEGGFNPFDAGDVMADILNDRACGADVSRADGSTPSLAPSMRLPPQWSGPGIPPGQSLLRGAGPAAAAGRPFMGSAPTGQAMHRLPFPSAPNFTGASVEPYSQPHPRPGLVQEPFQLGNGGHPPADYQGRLLSFALGSGQVPPPQPSLLDDFQRHRRMTEATIAPETLRQGPPGFDRTHALSAIREPGASSKPPQFTDDFNTLFPNVKVTYAPPPVSGSLASRVLNAPPGLQSGLRVHAEAEARDLPTRTFDPFNERGPGAPRTADSQAPAVPGRTRSALDAQDILKQFLQAQELTKSSTTARGMYQM